VLLLRTLDVLYARANILLFIFQAQFPSLVELRLPVFPTHRGITFDTPLSDDLVPNLTILEAPDQAIPLFIQNRPVRQLVLDTTSDLGSKPEDVISVLDQLSPAAVLETITICVTKLTQELCDALDTRFPNLKSLTILGNGVVWGPNPGGLGAHSIEVTRRTLQTFYYYYYYYVCMSVLIFFFFGSNRRLLRCSCRCNFLPRWSTCASAKSTLSAQIPGTCELTGMMCSC
jgi:hypothetical protein